MPAILKVNPRAAIYTAVQVTEEILTSPAQHLLRVFLGPDYWKPIDLSQDGKALSFRFSFFTHTARLNEFIVRDRKTNQLQVLAADEFYRLFYEYVEPLNPPII